MRRLKPLMFLSRIGARIPRSAVFVPSLAPTNYAALVSYYQISCPELIAERSWFNNAIVGRPYVPVTAPLHIYCANFPPALPPSPPPPPWLPPPPVPPSCPPCSPPLQPPIPLQPPGPPPSPPTPPLPSPPPSPPSPSQLPLSPSPTQAPLKSPSQATSRLNPLDAAILAVLLLIVGGRLHHRRRQQLPRAVNDADHSPSTSDIELDAASTLGAPSSTLGLLKTKKKVHRFERLGKNDNEPAPVRVDDESLETADMIARPLGASGRRAPRDGEITV